MGQNRGSMRKRPVLLVAAATTAVLGLGAALVAAFRLTPREAEVLHWVAKGKTNRDVGEIQRGRTRLPRHMPPM